MGFGHFFGSCCVSFLVAVQAAGMWGAEATLLEEFGARKIYEEAIVDGMCGLGVPSCGGAFTPSMRLVSISQ